MAICSAIHPNAVLVQFLDLWTVALSPAAAFGEKRCMQEELACCRDVENPGCGKLHSASNSISLPASCRRESVFLCPRKHSELAAASSELMQPLKPSYLFIFPKGQTQTDRQPPWNRPQNLLCHSHKANISEYGRRGEEGVVSGEVWMALPFLSLTS